VSDTPKRQGLFGLFRRDTEPVKPIAVEADQETPTAPADGARPITDPPAAAPAARPGNWFQRLKAGLTKSSSRLSQNITGIFTKRKLDAATLEELEDTLIQADLGVETAMRITAALAEGRFNKEI
jgi:fused signal recognition particle receptor